MAANRRKAVRRAIAYAAKIVALDGKWDCDCRVIDVSETGAKIKVEKAGEVPTDFMLALSAQGAASRRCHVMWATEGEIGVVFERRGKERSAA